MKIKTIFLTILISAVCISCENNPGSNEQELSIVGVWEVKSVEHLIPRDLSPEAFEPINDSTLSLKQTFGVLAIKKSKGKFVEFTRDNRVISNIMDSIRLTQFDFRYTYNNMDSLTTFSIMHPRDSSKIYMPTKTYFEDSYMVWIVDDFSLIKLEKVQ